MSSVYVGLFRPEGVEHPFSDRATVSMAPPPCLSVVGCAASGIDWLSKIDSTKHSAGWSDYRLSCAWLTRSTEFTEEALQGPPPRRLNVSSVRVSRAAR